MQFYEILLSMKNNKLRSVFYTLLITMLGLSYQFILENMSDINLATNKMEEHIVVDEKEEQYFLDFLLLNSRSAVVRFTEIEPLDNLNRNTTSANTLRMALSIPEIEEELINTFGDATIQRIIVSSGS